MKHRRRCRDGAEPNLVSFPPHHRTLGWSLWHAQAHALTGPAQGSCALRACTSSLRRTHANVSKSTKGMVSFGLLTSQDQHDPRRWPQAGRFPHHSQQGCRAGSERSSVPWSFAGDLIVSFVGGGLLLARLVQGEEGEAAILGLQGFFV